MLKVYCKNTGTYGEFPEGTTLLDMVDSFDFEKPYQILSAKVNNVSQGLKFRVFNNRDVEFLDFTSYSGRRSYCHSLCFLLSKAAQDVFPGSKILLRRPISKGYFCTLIKQDNTAICEEDVALIKARMQNLVDKALPFRR